MEELTNEVDNGVTKEFGFEQLIADQNRMEMKRQMIVSLKIHTALLVASAQGKGINVLNFFNSGQGSNQFISIDQFRDKLCEMAKVVGENEDEQTKQDLEAAVAVEALDAAIETCKLEWDRVDVDLFVDICHEKVQEYLRQVDIDDANEQSNQNKSQGGLKGPLPTVAPESLDIEIALLMTSAEAKGINVALWLGEGGNGGHIRFCDFSNKFYSLGQVVSVHEDDQKKGELDKATSAQSMQLIENLFCVDGSEEIDIGHFINTCKQKLATLNVAPQSTLQSGGAAAYMAEAKQWASTEARRPNPPPSGLHGHLDDDQHSHTNTRAKVTMHLPTTHTLSPSMIAATHALYEDDFDDAYATEAARANPDMRAQPGRGAYDEMASLSDNDDDNDSPNGSSGVRGVGRLRGNGADDEHESDERYRAARLGTNGKGKGKGRGKGKSIPSQQRTRMSMRTATNTDDIFVGSGTRSWVPSEAYAEDEQNVRELNEHFLDGSSLQRPERSGPSRGATRPSSAPLRSSERADVSTMGFSVDCNGHQLMNGRPVRPRSSDGTRARPTATAATAGMQRKSVSGPGMGNGSGGRDEQKLRHMQDLVEDTVRNAVRQADLYHVIQVHLGFIQPYMMIPARGVIVAAHPRPWLAMRDLQAAFLASRTRLSDSQIIIFIRLVKLFALKVINVKKKPKATRTTAAGASETKPAHGDEAKAGSRGDGDAIDEEELNAVKGIADSADGMDLSPRSVVKHGTVSADWVRRYLLHLRLTRRLTAKRVDSPVRGSKGEWVSAPERPLSASAVGKGRTRPSSAPRLGTSSSSDPIRSSNRRPSAGTTAGPPERHRISVSHEPLDWSDWNDLKEVDSKRKVSSRSKDFRRALAGRPHSLSKEEMSQMLDRLNVLPGDMLEAEVDTRVEAWKLDASGRRDFSHKFNVEIRKWQKESKCDWNKLAAPKRAELAASFKARLVKEMKDELMSSERLSASITKDLYWKYDEYCRDINYGNSSTWGEWLGKHVTKSKEQLQRLRDDMMERSRAAKAKAARSSAVAALAEVETQLNTAAKALNTAVGIEVRKTLVMMRKSSSSSGIGLAASTSARDALIRKRDFDKFFDRVLSRSEAERVGDLFRRTEADAAERLLEFDAEKSKRSDEEVRLWQMKKKSQLMKSKMDQRLEQEKQVEEREKREKDAKRAFDRWLHARKSNKYISKVDGKTRKVPIPVTAKAAHRARWNDDIDLHRYYDEKERRY